MSNISSNIGVGGGGVDTVDQIPSTGSDGDLIRFRGILFRWDKGASAWIPLPTRAWQTLEDWSTGDLTHWEIINNPTKVSYSVANGFLEVTIDDTGGNYTAFNISFSGGDVLLPPRLELRTRFSAHESNPSTGSAEIRWLLRDTPGSNPLSSRVSIAQGEHGDFHYLEGYDANGNRTFRNSNGFTWQQDNKYDLVWGGAYEGEASDSAHFYSEVYDEGGSLQVDSRGGASPFSRAADFHMFLNPFSDAHSAQTFRIHSVSLRSLS